MPRLLGVEIPAKKKVAYSLRYIYGVGPARADQVVKEVGIKADMRAQDLTEEQLNKIMHVITEHKWVVEATCAATSPATLSAFRRSTATGESATARVFPSAASAPARTPAPARARARLSASPRPRNNPLSPWP